MSRGRVVAAPEAPVVFGSPPGPPKCVIRPDGLTADLVVVDATNTNKLAQVSALSDDELLKAAATVMEELRRRGLLFAAIAAIVDWQDKMFLKDNGVAS